MEKTFDEEKILDTTSSFSSTTSFLSTTISSLDQDELNENLTNLQIENFNKTGLELKKVLTTGATTATSASYKLLAQLTTWNKMAAYDDVQNSKLDQTLFI